MATDRLGSIVAFVRVAELGSFAKAAKALGVSSSAVSKSVARLEDRLELRLFQRTTRALSLTEEGRLFFQTCNRVLAELDEAEQSLRERATTPSGVLKVEFPAALGRLKIVPALGTLTRKYPALRIEASFEDRLTDLVDAGLDAVVRIGEPRELAVDGPPGWRRTLHCLCRPVLYRGARQATQPGRLGAFRLHKEGAAW